LLGAQKQRGSTVLAAHQAGRRSDRGGWNTPELTWMGRSRHSTMPSSDARFSRWSLEGGKYAQKSASVACVATGAAGPKGRGEHDEPLHEQGCSGGDAGIPVGELAISPVISGSIDRASFPRFGWDA
jgi:hypothetical protein